MKIKIKIDALFYLSFALWISYSLLRRTFLFQYFYNVISARALIMLCVSLLFVREFSKGKYTLKLLAKLTIVGVLVYLILRIGVSNLTNEFLCILIFCYGARDIDFKRIARFSAIYIIILFFIVVAMSQVGIIEDYVFFQDGRNRHGLGFLYALFPSAVVFNLTGLIISYKGKNIKIKELIGLFVLNLVVFELTDSRMSFGISCLFIIIALLLKYYKGFIKLKLLQNILVIIYPISCVLSFVLVYLYSQGIPWVRELNIILENRLKFGMISLAEYGIPMFGNNSIEMLGNGLDIFGNTVQGTYNWVDSMYIQMLERMGLVFSISLLCIMTYAVYRYKKENDMYMLFILALYGLRGIIDDSIFYLVCNTFWIVIGNTFIGTFRTFQGINVNKKIEIPE